MARLGKVSLDKSVQGPIYQRPPDRDDPAQVASRRQLLRDCEPMGGSSGQDAQDGVFG
jgi:hypothetical protein